MPWIWYGKERKMRANIHPELKDATVTCACGATFKTKSTKEKIRNYWLNHLKLALGIASFLAVNATTTFFTGTYSGIYRSCSGTPAYIIAAGILVFSILFIANAFYPISKKIRPKYGLTLLALALVLETALR